MSEPAAPRATEQDHQGGAPRPLPATGEPRGAWLLFRVRAVWLACPALEVDGILEMVSPSPVPRAGSHILGLVAHGDSPLAVLDLARMLALPEAEAASDTELGLRRILVVRAGGLKAGLACDRAAGVTELAASQLRVPTILRGIEHLAGEAETAQGVTGLIDLDGLLEAARVKA